MFLCISQDSEGHRLWLFYNLSDDVSLFLCYAEPGCFCSVYRFLLLVTQLGGFYIFVVYRNFMPVISVLERVRQEDCQAFQVKLG